MSSIKAKVNQSRNLRGVLTPQKEIAVTKVGLGPSINLEDLGNISAELLTDGSVLIYNEDTGFWEATPIVQNPKTTINGGIY